MNKVVIKGGGAAGLRAASRLKRNGIDTVVIERESTLGGHLAQWDRLFPDGQKAKDVLDRLLSDIDGVEVMTNHTITEIQRENDIFKIKLDDNTVIQADAVLDTTGFDIFKAEKKQEYGYGIYDRVITNAELESFFKTGSDRRIDNPKKIGFVHCVGSRDIKVGNTYCSKVCCATALKQACEMREAFPESEVYTFYMDLRMFGKGYEDLYLKAQQDYGVKCVRGRVSEVAEAKDGRLVIKAEDTLLGKPLKMTLDLLVLMCGMERKDGFIATKNGFVEQNITDEKGIFVAGTAIQPMTLPETMANADAAVLDIVEFLKRRK